MIGVSQMTRLKLEHVLGKEMLKETAWMIMSQWWVCEEQTAKLRKGGIHQERDLTEVSDRNWEGKFNPTCQI